MTVCESAPFQFTDSSHVTHVLQQHVMVKRGRQMCRTVRHHVPMSALNLTSLTLFFFLHGQCIYSFQMVGFLSSFLSPPFLFFLTFFYPSLSSFFWILHSFCFPSALLFSIFPTSCFFCFNFLSFFFLSFSIFPFLSSVLPFFFVYLFHSFHFPFTLAFQYIFYTFFLSFFLQSFLSFLFHSFQFPFTLPSQYM